MTQNLCDRSSSSCYGHIIGFSPVHAVVANGVRGMYDYLTRELPAELRANTELLSRLGRQLELNMDGMTPLQLAVFTGDPPDVEVAGGATAVAFVLPAGAFLPPLAAPLVPAAPGPWPGAVETV